MNVESWMMKCGLEMNCSRYVILSSWFVENILPHSFSFLLFSQWITNDCAVTMKIVWLSVQLVDKRTRSAQKSPLPLSTSSNLKSTKPTASATITYHAAFAVNVENGSLHLRRVWSSQRVFVSAGTLSIFPVLQKRGGGGNGWERRHRFFHHLDRLVPSKNCLGVNGQSLWG